MRTHCKHGHVWRPMKNGQCAECHRIKSALWRETNRERHRQMSLDWVARNKGRNRQNSANWREANRPRHRALIAKWKSSEGNKGRLAEAIRYRQALKRKAAPKWLTKAQRREMAELYILAKLSKSWGVPLHVDHIIPLVSGFVCGLHVPWNLQLLTPQENMAKGCSLVET